MRINLDSAPLPPSAIADEGNHLVVRVNQLFDQRRDAALPLSMQGGYLFRPISSTWPRRSTVTAASLTGEDDLVVVLAELLDAVREQIIDGIRHVVADEEWRDQLAHVAIG